MEQQFHEYSTIGPSQFAQELNQLLGDDFEPDPLFLEESWTLGVPAALENWRDRSCSRAKNDRQKQTPFGNGQRRSPQRKTAGSDYFEAVPCAAEVLAATRAARIASHYAGSSQAAAPAWKPQDWTPEDRITQSWLPHGWTPRPGPAAGRPPQSPPEAMSHASACRLLGVTASSSRAQVRSAYRRLVSLWHPDRLQQADVELRELATERMAEINEAYHLLRESELAKSA
jgi:DnaJ-domain-containing protein 1